MNGATTAIVSKGWKMERRHDNIGLGFSFKEKISDCLQQRVRSQSKKARTTASARP